MKNQLIKRAIGWVSIILISTTLLSGCGKEEDIQNSERPEQNIDSSTGTHSNSETESKTETDNITDNQTTNEVLELEVRFGDNGEPFMMSLEDNETAQTIARYVGTADWRLPIYETDENTDYDVMQYYDVSSRYDIPSNPEIVTSEKAGEVYYSDPNRIILFYHDAEITGEYTKIGTFDATDEFVTAVEENPVLEGWGNKIVQIAKP